jgi:uncharacterized membrane protein
MSRLLWARYTHLKVGKRVIYKLTMLSSTLVGVGLAILVIWKVYSMYINQYAASFIFVVMGIFCLLLRKLFYRQIADAKRRLSRD